MPVQCNINPLGFFLNVTRFVIVECKQLKILKKKTCRFRVFNSQGRQHRERTTQTCSTEIAVG